MPSMVSIARRALQYAVDEKAWLPAGPVAFTQWSKNGATHSATDVKFGAGQHLSSHYKISRLWVRNAGHNAEYSNMADVCENSMACHPRATCHIAGCIHLAKSMSWSWHMIGPFGRFITKNAHDDFAGPRF